MAKIMKVVNTVLILFAIAILLILILQQLTYSGTDKTNQDLYFFSAAIMVCAGFFPIGAALLNIITVFCQRIKSSMKILNLILVIFISFASRFVVAIKMGPLIVEANSLVFDTYDMETLVNTPELLYTPEAVANMASMSYVFTTTMIVVLIIYVVTPFIYKTLPESNDPIVAPSMSKVNLYKKGVANETLSKPDKSPFEG